MAKKSKAQRRAIRKEGWKQAAQGLKQMYVDSSANVLSSMGKGFTSGASSAYSKGNRTKLPAANAAGAALAGLGGAAVGAVKSIPSTAKTMAKGNWNFIKGVFKGIFNHPDWWAYRNVLSIPAYNENRPFDPVSLKSIEASLIKTAPGPGVSHVVKQNVVYTDMLNSDSFKLATIEAFKEIRLQLKSNLPYTQDEYDQFIGLSMAICAKAKAVERALGWYNQVRADIPELQDAMHSVPMNPTEVGIVDVSQIALLTDANYPTTLNTYRKLQATLKNISIPQKLADYISWWVASVFIDQAAPNAQLYINELRDVPIYTVDQNNAIVAVGTWDIATGSIEDILGEAKVLLNRFGIMNADIAKTGRYGYITLADVDVGSYQPIVLTDPEFFTILINSTNIPFDDVEWQYMFNPEYIRVDTLESLSAQNLVGVTNSIAPWAKVDVPFKVISQCAYIVSDLDLYSNINVAANVSMDSNTDTQAFKAFTSYWYQVTSKISSKATYAITSANTAVNATFTSTTRCVTPINGVYTVNSVTLYLNNTQPINLGQFADTQSGSVYIPLIKCANLDNYLTLEVDIAGGAITAVKLCFANNFSDLISGTKYASCTVINTMDTLTANTHYRPIVTQVFPGIKRYDLAFDQSSLSCTQNTSNWINLEHCYEPNAYFYPGTDTIIAYSKFNYIDSVHNTLSAQAMNLVSVAQFTQLVDYHIPLYMFDYVEVKLNGKTAAFPHMPALLKQTFIPLIFSKSDVEAVLYWMYLGLFSMI